jgi:alkaline phosphatase
MNPIKLTCQLAALLSLLTVASVNCSRDWSEDEYRYKWYDYSKNKINKILNRKINKNVAKNIVLYLGDGMGMSTITVI